jgi:hypothetical protein
MSRRTRSAPLLLTASAFASAGCGAIALLPWYSLGGWRSLGTVGIPEASTLTLSWSGSQWQFGARPLGLVLIAVTAAACVLALLVIVVGPPRARVLHAAGVASAAASLALSLGEALATPPFGDEPALHATWGAGLGVLVAAASLLALTLAWVARARATAGPPVGLEQSRGGPSRVTAGRPVEDPHLRADGCR